MSLARVRVGIAGVLTGSPSGNIVNEVYIIPPSVYFVALAHSKNLVFI
jgi:hypothetical protein